MKVLQVALYDVVKERVRHQVGSGVYPRSEEARAAMVDANETFAVCRDPAQADPSESGCSRNLQRELICGREDVLEAD